MAVQPGHVVYMLKYFLTSHHLIIIAAYMYIFLNVIKIESRFHYLSRQINRAQENYLERFFELFDVSTRRRRVVANLA